MIARILIVDDEAPARARLTTLLGDVAADCPHRLVAGVSDAQAALACLGAETVDIVLLDVQMPGMNGVGLAQLIAEMPRPPAVIFVTAFDDYAVDAFEVRAIDYLLKPVRAARLIAALRRVMDARSADAIPRAGAAGPAPESATDDSVEARPVAEHADARRHFPVQERGRLLLVPVADVLYLKAELKYVTLRTVSREYLIEASLHALEAEFETLFVRVHRNTLVARAAVTGVERTLQGSQANADGQPGDGWQVILQGLDERLPISRRQWSTVKALVK